MDSKASGGSKPEAELTVMPYIRPLELWEQNHSSSQGKAEAFILGSIVFSIAEIPSFFFSLQNLNCFLIDNNGFILVSKASKQVRCFLCLLIKPVYRAGGQGGANWTSLQISFVKA